MNGISDDIEKLISSSLSIVNFVYNPTDVGFAKAMNQGVALAKGTFVYLTANDIIMSEHFLFDLLTEYNQTDGWGLISGLWYNYYSPDEVVLAGGTLEWSSSIKPKILGKPKNWLTAYEVDWIAGASIFTSLKTWNKIGGFREDFFAHYEDVEICLRVRKIGGFVKVYPLSKLYHHEHTRGISENHKLEFFKLRNYAAINIIYGPTQGLILFGLKFVFFTAPRIAIILKSYRFYANVIFCTLTNMKGWLQDRKNLKSENTTPLR